MRLLTLVFGLVLAAGFALALLAQAGMVAPWPAAAAILLVALLGIAVLMRLNRDIAAVGGLIRRVGTADTRSDTGADSKSDSRSDSIGAPPDLGLMEPLREQLERAGQRLADRDATAERGRRADSLILERLPDPLIVVGEDRAVIRTNLAARAAFGEDLPAVLRNPALRAAVDRAITSGSEQTVALSLPVPVPREVQATVVAMEASGRDAGRAVVILSDRTLDRAVERMREDFVANVSHELRTPLASMIGFIDTLRGPAADDPPAQQRFLGIMSEQGTRMNRLIDDLLSLSRIELMEHQAPADPCELGSLLNRLAASQEPRLRERQAKLLVAVEPDLPTIAADADQIMQVVQNLLDNAVKYGRDQGVIRLSAGLAPAEDAQWPKRPGIVIAVADDGIGIAREHLPRLTERFYRVDKGRSRAAGGTGLGLAIVKHIVNRHRGQLRIASDEGVGTTVSVWLPLSQPAGRPLEGN